MRDHSSYTPAVLKTCKELVMKCQFIKEWNKITIIRTLLSQKEVDKPTRLLQFVAFVHLPFSFRSLDLFVASLLFRKGTSFCVIRRK